MHCTFWIVLVHFVLIIYHLSKSPWINRSYYSIWIRILTMEKELDLYQKWAIKFVIHYSPCVWSFMKTSFYLEDIYLFPPIHPKWIFHLILSVFRILIKAYIFPSTNFVLHLVFLSKTPVLFSLVQQVFEGRPLFGVAQNKTLCFPTNYYF